MGLLGLITHVYHFALHQFQVGFQLLGVTMSRTIRRKNGHDLHRFTWDWVTRDSKYGGTYTEKTPETGNAKVRSIAHYHSDAHMGWSAGVFERFIQHKTHRARCRSELALYRKDIEHEVQILSNPRWPYWN
jgi:hypothetical protein